MVSIRESSINDCYIMRGNDVSSDASFRRVHYGSFMCSLTTCLFVGFKDVNSGRSKSGIAVAF